VFIQHVLGFDVERGRKAKPDAGQNLIRSNSRRKINLPNV